MLRGFARGSVGTPSASSGDAGLIPDQEGPTCLEQLSLWPQLLSLCSRAQKPPQLSPSAATTEARVPKARASQEKPPQREVRTPYLAGGPHSHS